jgi:hypothetical protein
MRLSVLALTTSVIFLVGCAATAPAAAQSWAKVARAANIRAE